MRPSGHTEAYPEELLVILYVWCLKVGHTAGALAGKGWGEGLFHSEDNCWCVCFALTQVPDFSLDNLRLHVILMKQHLTLSDIT